MTAASQRLLLVEDDKALRSTLCATLRAEGYTVIEAGSVAQARHALAHQPPELIILDLGLPDADGMTLLGILRAARDLTPVIVLTARGEEAAKVTALDLGADDYVTKPFGTAELLARIRSALRHGVQTRGAPPTVEIGNLRIDLAKRTVSKNGAEIRLSRKEFDLLAELAVHLGTPVPHAELLRAVWGAEDTDIRYLRIYVGQVREKIEDDPQTPRFVISEQGFGYRLG